MTDAWYLLYQPVQQQWQMLDTFCISWSKNSDRCLIPFASTGPKKKLQMLATLCISRFKNSDRCLIPFVSAGPKKKLQIFKSAIPKSKGKFLRRFILFYAKIHCDREFSCVSILQLLNLSSSSNKYCRMSSEVFSLSNVLLYAQHSMLSTTSCKPTWQKRSLYFYTKDPQWHF